VESAVSRVQGVVSISSQSSYGRSRITIEFGSSTDLNIAASDVHEAVSRIARRLPEKVEAPSVVKADADASPIIRLAISSRTISIEELTRLVEDRIVQRLTAVLGVAEAQVYGTRAPIIRVAVNQ